MTDFLVGNGNLPNVYFNSIKIFDGNNVEGAEKSIVVKISLSVKDKKINGNFQWSDNPIMTEYLVINLLQSTSQPFSDLITNGQYTLSKSDYKKSNLYSSRDVSVVTKKLNLYNPDQIIMEGMDDNNNETYGFYYDFEFVVKQNKAINLTYFANVSPNITDLAADYSADFSSDLLSLYQGPVSSEVVFSNSEIQKQTNKILLPDGTQYSGPVHFHEPTGYMVGPFHTKRPHSTLLVSQIDNKKIKDLRNPQQNSKMLNTQTGLKSLVVDGYTTNDEEGRVKKLYFINYDAIFSQKTKFGNLLKQLDPDVYAEVLANFKIKKLTFKRSQIRIRKKTNPYAKSKEIAEVIPSTSVILGTTKDLEPYNLSSSVSNLSTIKEVPPNDNKIRFISFTDNQAKDLYTGKFTYRLSVEMIDNTVDYLNSKYSEYSSDIKSLESYYLRGSKRSSYDSIRQEFLPEFQASEDSLYDLQNLASAINVPWVIGVENYGSLYKFLNNVTDEDMDAIKESIFNSINPKTGSPDGILLFIENYKTLLEEFAFKFDLNKIFQGITKKVAPMSKNPILNNLIKIEYSNLEFVDFSETRVGYRVMPENTEKDDFSTITLSDYRRREQEERDRFFQGSPSLNNQESRNISRAQRDAFKDIGTSAPSFMSPLSIINKGKKIDLSRAARADSKELNKMVNKINRSKRKKKKYLSKRVKFLRPVSTKSVDPKPKRQPDPDVRDYLGQTTTMYSISEQISLRDMDAKDTIKTEEKIKSSLNRKLKKKMTRNFDLTKENNVIFKKMRRKNVDMEKQLRDMPMHVKAVVASRSDTCKTNFLDSPVDVLESDETDNKFLMTHFLVQEMMYLEGFQRDKDGDPMITAPIWKRIDNDVVKTTNKRSVICKMINYVDAELELDIPDEIRLPVFDSIFTIENDTNILPSPPQDKSSQLLISYNNTSTVNYDYCTSNIIVQSEKQNGFLNNSTTIQSETAIAVADGAQQTTVVSTSSPITSPSAPSSGRSY